ncbi:unnamed protein product [Pleuronectes platessa]|uniref:Uncharacterized protein n=1 Tax=Pleuronectes platessa TaxID=8262 RepID=A0A9N7VPR6_PLEPL|nr:unnamed protein product [Pleuronectes platessa]
MSKHLQTLWRDKNIKKKRGEKLRDAEEQLSSILPVAMEIGPGQVEPLAGVFAVTWRVWVRGGGLFMMKVASSPHARQRRVHGSSAHGSDFPSVLGWRGSGGGGGLTRSHL